MISFTLEYLRTEPAERIHGTRIPKRYVYTVQNNFELYDAERAGALPNGRIRRGSLVFNQFCRGDRSYTRALFISEVKLTPAQRRVSFSYPVPPGFGLCPAPAPTPQQTVLPFPTT